MRNNELVHSVEFAEHLTRKWARKMFYPPRSAVYQLLGQWLAIGMEEVHEAKVLELGYGTGDFSKVIEEISLYKDIQYTGIDISESFQAIASKRLPGLRFTLGDGASLGFENGCFDFSYTIDVLRHNERWGEILGELSRVTQHEVFVADIFGAESGEYDGFVEGVTKFHVEGVTKFHVGHSHAWSAEYFAAEAQKHFNHITVIPVPGHDNKAFILSNRDAYKEHVFQTPVHVVLSSLPPQQPILFGRMSKTRVFAVTIFRAVRNIARSAFH